MRSPATRAPAAERSVRTYLKELETVALLEIEQRGNGKTNLYKLYLTISLKVNAGRDRQILPVTLYKNRIKNTHLKKTQQRNAFFK